MSRSTQYVGLNKYARNFVANAIKVEEYDMTTGIFGEVIKGHIYHMNPPQGPNTKYIFKEVVQTTLWSSGPMIFTCLAVTLVKECGQRLKSGKYFQWMLDPTVNEYDIETGRYYV
jgi:hypothetical protein